MKFVLQLKKEVLSGNALANLDGGGLETIGRRRVC